MTTTLAEVLRRFGPAYVRTHALCTRQARAWRAIVACRTPALGGEQWCCDGCGAQAWRWHSCRNRHCPQCQTQARDAWRAARLAELLTVPYCHLVFTLPHEINALAGAHPRWVYDTLMQTAARTLTEFAANPRWLGGTAAFTLVLHTWTQDLMLHLHVHALMACGALGICPDSPDGQACWLKPRRGERFLFPVHALSRVFRGKFMQALEHAEQAGELPRDPADSAQARQQRHQALRRHDWVVYAKTPLAGPAAVLDYLARYTHRTAIGNERLQGIQGEQVRFKVRANDKGGAGGKTSKALDGVEFIARLLRHVLPSGFKRIRHYGLLAPAHKTERMATARRLLAMPQANPVAIDDARAFMQRVTGLDVQRCQHCGTGRWVMVARVAACEATCVVWDATAQRPTGLIGTDAACRGPP